MLAMLACVALGATAAFWHGGDWARSVNGLLPGMTRSAMEARVGVAKTPCSSEVPEQWLQLRSPGEARALDSVLARTSYHV